MSIRHRLGALSDMVIRWRIVFRLDIRDQETIDRLKRRFGVEEKSVINRALKLYAEYALSELPTLHLKLSPCAYAPYFLMHDKPPEIDETTVFSGSFLAGWRVYRRLSKVRAWIGADGFTPVIRNALALLERVTADDVPSLYVRNAAGKYEPYGFY